MTHSDATFRPAIEFRPQTANSDALIARFKHIDDRWRQAIAMEESKDSLERILHDAGAFESEHLSMGPNLDPSLSFVWLGNPILDAILYFKPRAAISLIELGQGLMSRGVDGRTLLHYASGRAMGSVVACLITKGVAIDARSGDRQTPLHDAVRNACKDTACQLLMAEADVHAVDNRKNTPLHWAFWSENSATCLTMVQHGALTTARNARGHTPLEMLVAEGGDPAALAHIAAEVDAYLNARKACEAIDRIMANMRIQKSSSGPENIRL